MRCWNPPGVFELAALDRLQAYSLGPTYAFPCTRRRPGDLP
jgi:hypothetical protein